MAKGIFIGVETIDVARHARRHGASLARNHHLHRSVLQHAKRARNMTRSRWTVMWQREDSSLLIWVVGEGLGTRSGQVSAD